jgi:peptide/nickel transport system ATP-binding protein
MSETTLPGTTLPGTADAPAAGHTVIEPVVPLLSVDHLTITAFSPDHHGEVTLVDDVSFHLGRGETFGIVGESGSGKSMTCRSVLGILPAGVHTAPGSAVTFDGTDLLTLPDKQWMSLRGTRIAAVFQDPGSYLNPSMTVGAQLVEVLRIKGGLKRRQAKERALELFRDIGLRNPPAVFRQYPFELSGGMLQRVLIAIAISGDPDLLIADEATTALDVTVQAEVLDLLAELQERTGLALVVVSHDLAVVAQVCERVMVMQAGVVVETGPTEEVLHDPQHQYTRELMRAHAEYGLDRWDEEQS